MAVGSAAAQGAPPLPPAPAQQLPAGPPPSPPSPDPNPPASSKPQPAGDSDDGVLEVKSQMVDIDGCPIHVLTTGPEYGQVVFLLHGMAFKAWSWDESGVLKELARHGRRAIAVDLPGFGGSPQCKNIPPERIVERFVATLCPRKPVIVAPSMSGRYALPYMVEHGDRTAGLVAIAPVGIPPLERKLSQIKVPVLAVWGEKDTTIPLDQMKTLVSQVDKGELFIMPGAPHACQAHDPKLFVERLIQFLDELPVEKGAPRQLGGQTDAAPGSASDPKPGPTKPESSPPPPSPQPESPKPGCLGEKPPVRD